MSAQPEALRLADEWWRKTQSEAGRRNSAYDHYGMDNTPENVDPLGAKMATELRRLHADAERYRYLRNRNPQEILPVIGNAAGVWIDCDDENGVLTLLTGEDADAAIDAAMRKI